VSFDAQQILEFSVLQAAAECYLDGVTERNQIIERLQNGSNHYAFQPATGEGRTRLTEQQIEWFLSTFDIVDHYANDSTGFSATVFRDRRSGDYTLSPRSTEYANENEGGDWMRDGLQGAGGEINVVGIAFAQASSMERYLANLRQGQRFDPRTGRWVIDPKLEGLSQALSGGVGINVTGYSLGGHLANVFTVLHGDLTRHTYLFNAAGLGGIDGLRPTTAGYVAALRQKLALYDAVMLGGSEAPNRIVQTGEITPGVILSAEDRQGLLSAIGDNLMRPADPNRVYSNAVHAWLVSYLGRSMIGAGGGPVGAALAGLLGLVQMYTVEPSGIAPVPDTPRCSAAMYLVTRTHLAAALVFAIAIPAFATDFERLGRADRENDFKALVGDFKTYDACYEKGFTGAECGRYRLTSTDNPEYWPYPDVPPMKWPDAPKTRIHKAGMKPSEYFEALCKAEAGEFIYKTVKADSIYMIRPRKEERDEMIRDRYGIEDPYGYGQGDQGDTAAGAILRGNDPRYSEFGSPGYRFVETPATPVSMHWAERKPHDPSWFEPPGGKPFRVFYGAEPTSKRRFFNVRHENELQSRYGYTWRGIRRPYDREMGIGGGEIAVVDLKTNEILGLRRGFILGNRLKPGGMWWLTGAACPHYSQLPGLGTQRRRDKDVDYVNIILSRVVIPPGQFVPFWDTEVRRHREELEKSRQRGLGVPEGAMLAFEAGLVRRFGEKAAYYDRLRKQGYPVDEYLRSIRGKEQP
jgi:hypothetical protein